MKYIVELLLTYEYDASIEAVELHLTYEIDAPDMRDAQKQAYVKLIDIVDKDTYCITGMVYGINTEDGYNKKGAIK